VSRVLADDVPTAEHWANVYATKDPTAVSWFQPSAATSLELVRASGVGLNAPIVDVGSGASTLVDGLLASGYSDISLVDIADGALDATRRRLGTRAREVAFAAADVTRWSPSREFALWHDRAVFHFLTDESARDAYRQVVRAALAPGGTAIIGTFDLTGPSQCSGLPVRRYSAESLAAEFAGLLRPVETRHEAHTTPSGGTQGFVFVRFVRDVG
jgi:hypothetical protein